MLSTVAAADTAVAVHMVAAAFMAVEAPMVVSTVEAVFIAVAASMVMQLAVVELAFMVQ